VTMYDKRLAAMIDDVDNVARVLEMIAIHAPTDEPVLLVGARSSGASFLAEAIHACSPRRDRRLVRARCGLYSGMLLEAQLFGRSSARNGHMRATCCRKKGMAAIADRGSLFVEQIQNTTPSVQTILFDLISDKEYVNFERTVIHHADVRLIASARPGLEDRAMEGQFHRDLFSALRPSSIEIIGGCASRSRILAVIDLLRAEVMPRGSFATAQITDWWANAARTATQTAASMRLRKAVEAVAQLHPASANVETIFLAAVRHMSQNSVGTHRVEISASSGN
jgi:transcriptional regulator of acetoin/glycerol metabolism